MVTADHHCTRCGFTAHISGGPDMLTLSRSETFACPRHPKTLFEPPQPGGCGLIWDNAVALARYDDTTGQHSQEVLPPPMCKGCGRPAVIWNRGDPCPACGAEGSFIKTPGGGLTFLD